MFIKTSLIHFIMKYSFYVNINDTFNSLPAIRFQREQTNSRPVGILH